MLKSIFLFLCVIANTVFASEKLIFAIDIIRHGDRTPLIELPKAPHHWEEGLGQLTPTGMAQEYQLGQRLRKEYIKQYQLLPKKYSIKTMYVRSTEYDRTVMSAQSLLLGLYPQSKGPKIPVSQTYALPHGYQPIPIFTLPRRDDILGYPFHDELLFRKLLQKYLFSTPEWMATAQELKQHMPKWRAATGLPLTDPMQLVKLADAIYIYQLYQLPLPTDLSQEDITLITDTVRSQWTAFYKNPAIATVSGSKLLKTIVEKLKMAHEKNTELKYILFSAHDNTLLAQMAVLDQPLDEWPQYASRLNFSLFDDGNGDAIVKITYNNKPVLLPACGGRSCHLEDLVRLADEKEKQAQSALSEYNDD
ncbi:MAG: histidine phosphatase family protein [Legionellales bacterium]|nr:histidine phosphatase family protein [Legionellales bacterium]